MALAQGSVLLTCLLILLTGDRCFTFEEMSVDMVGEGGGLFGKMLEMMLDVMFVHKVPLLRALFLQYMWKRGTRLSVRGIGGARAGLRQSVP